MRYLITGGAGFIGSHLSEHLLAEGHEVLILDDLSTGEMANIVHLKSHPSFSYTIDSVINSRVTAELVDMSDIVVHLAAAVGVRLIVESPVRTIETNVRGTEVVLEHAAKKQKQVILASTSEVYGKTTKIPFSEQDDLVMGATDTGRWSYACSKAIDEFLGLAYWKEKGVPVTVVRFFNTVGPRQVGRYGMVLPSFVKQALQGVPLTVYGDGLQSRCFCHVGDVVGAVSKLSREQDAVGKVFNIGSDSEISILRLAQKVIEVVGSQSEIAFVPYEEAYGAGFEDMQRRVPDLARIRQLIGYRPSRDMESIIRSVVDYQSPSSLRV